MWAMLRSECGLTWNQFQAMEYESTTRRCGD